jgi:hypothetical protein
MRRNRFGLVIIGFAVGLVLYAAVSVPSASAGIFGGGFSVTFSCTEFTTTQTQLTFDRNNTGHFDEAYFYQIVDGAGTVIARYPDSGAYEFQLGETVGFGGVTLAYNITAPRYNPLKYQWISPEGNGLDQQIAFTATGTCEDLDAVGETPNDSETPPDTPAGDPSTQPGPDMVPIPQAAVVGQFVRSTPLYFAPMAEATSDITLEPGKTLWVLGVDQSGQFYKVLISGDTAWVPVDSMQPNPDGLWNNTPLPSNVVQ